MRAHRPSKKLGSEMSLGPDLKIAPAGQQGVRVVLESIASPGSTVLSLEIPDVGAEEVSRAIYGAFSATSMIPPVGPANEAPRRTLGLLHSSLETYAELRGLSRQQQLIVRLYLIGQNDKEIAHELQCAECTVYEHWRRMARKAGGTHKEDVVTDFHRFLARSTTSERRLSD